MHVEIILQDSTQDEQEGKERKYFGTIESDRSEICSKTIGQENGLQGNWNRIVGILWNWNPRGAFLLCAHFVFDSSERKLQLHFQNKWTLSSVECGLYIEFDFKVWNQCCLFLTPCVCMLWYSQDGWKRLCLCVFLFFFIYMLVRVSDLSVSVSRSSRTEMSNVYVAWTQKKSTVDFL